MKKFNLFLSILAIAIVCSYGYTYLHNGQDINKMSLFGYIINYVQSGSMTPKIETYDFVVSKRINFEDVKVGDIITYECNHIQADDGQIITIDKPIIVIHRVIEKDTDYLITKGDSNEIQDPWIVEPNQVISKYIWKIPNPTK